MSFNQLSKIGVAVLFGFTLTLSMVGCEPASEPAPAPAPAGGGDGGGEAPSSGSAAP
ncbi:MAG: hypothetical protein KDA78_15805 [Planctomycetaceae bacterium]|nr:hypothetical protein [Planctomycetaceae bacterium]